MDIKKRTEALLLAANRALSVKDIVELLEIQSAKEESEVLSAVVSLKEDYEDKPYDLVEVSSGYRIQLNQDYSKDIELKKYSSWGEDKNGVKVQFSEGYKRIS